MFKHVWIRGRCVQSQRTNLQEPDQPAGRVVSTEMLSSEPTEALPSPGDARANCVCLHVLTTAQPQISYETVEPIPTLVQCLNRMTYPTAPSVFYSWWLDNSLGINICFYVLNLWRGYSLNNFRCQQLTKTSNLFKGKVLRLFTGSHLSAANINIILHKIIPKRSLCCIISLAATVGEKKAFNLLTPFDTKYSHYWWCKINLISDQGRAVIIHPEKEPSRTQRD